MEGPTSRPVWAVMLDGCLYFATDRDSVKGRNLSSNKWVAIHLDDSVDVLVVDGTVTPVEDPEVVEAADRVFGEKYVTVRGGTPYSLTMNPEAQLWCFEPGTVTAWWELAMASTTRRWRLRACPGH